MMGLVDWWNGLPRRRVTRPISRSLLRASVMTDWGAGYAIRTLMERPGNRHTMQDRTSQPCEHVQAATWYLLFSMAHRKTRKPVNGAGCGRH